MPKKKRAFKADRAFKDIRGNGDMVERVKVLPDDGGLKRKFAGGEPDRRGEILTSAFHAEKHDFNLLIDHGVIERKEVGIADFLSTDGILPGIGRV